MTSAILGPLRNPFRNHDVNGPFFHDVNGLSPRGFQKTEENNISDEGVEVWHLGMREWTNDRSLVKL